MIYTIEKANLISEQLRKFTAGYTHHVVGHYSNIDFWVHEAVEALNAIDHHKKRFEKMFEAQKAWNEEHGTVVHERCPVCDGKCEFSDGKPPLPKLRHRAELADARKGLVDSTYAFLIRCFRIGLLTSEDLNKRCDSIGTSVDPNDL